MNPNSSFIQNLALGKPTSTQYIILGGNLDKYLAKDEDERGIMDKTLTQTGDWVYKDIPNDIAVGLESIFAAPALEKHEVSCHHLNYFRIQESLEMLNQVI